MIDRSSEFQLDLSKSFNLMNIHEDTLENIPNDVWLQKQFRSHFLAHQNQEYTDNLFKLAEGQTVLATFERIRREVQDLQYIAMLMFGKASFQTRPPITPVTSYRSCAASKNSDGAFTFTTRKLRKYVDVTMELRHHPQSAVSRNMPTGQYIGIEINYKIDQFQKFADSLTRSLLSGELLIDVITNKLWPELDKNRKPLLQIEKPLAPANVQKEAVSEVEVPGPAEIPAEASAEASVVPAEVPDEAVDMVASAENLVEAPAVAPADHPVEVLAEPPAELPIEVPVEVAAEVPPIQPIPADIPPAELQAPPTPVVIEIPPADPKPMEHPPVHLELKESRRVGGAFGGQRSGGPPAGRGGFGAVPEEPHSGGYGGGRGGGHRANGGNGAHRGARGARGYREQSADRGGRGRGAHRGGPPRQMPPPLIYDFPAPAGGFGIGHNEEAFPMNYGGHGAPPAPRHNNGRAGFVGRGGSESANWRK